MGKYFVKTVKPNIDVTCATAYADKDILFDWHAIDLPRGASKLMGITTLLKGTNGADGNQHDMDLLFAKGNDSGAPISLGTVNAAVTGEGWYNNIIGRVFIDTSAETDDGDLVYQNVLISPTTLSQPKGLVLSGNENENNVSPAFDRIYIAAIAKGAFDFGTAVTLNQAGNQAVTTTSTTLTLDGAGDPRHSFAIGDELIAADGALIGNVTAIASDTSMTVDAVATALADDDEICNRQPITFVMSFEK
jgi:hypothetical protein|tara:strand:- start:115 stop:858 length:744 start_codon:yes stop_codon:yes gene_type:complete